MRRIDKIKFKDYFTPWMIFAIVSIIICLPILRNFGNWGGMDWDEVFFWQAVARETILKFHQFPLWNPYAQPEGALVFIAYPNSPFLSPLFLVVLIFGPIYGTKLLIVLHFFIGLLGMFLLAKTLALDNACSYLVAFVYMLSSIFSLHIVEGHFEWLSMAFLPWLLLSFLRSLKKPIYILAGVFFLSLILLEGSVDVFAVTIIFLIIFFFLLILQRRSLIPVKNIFLIFMITFFLCYIKLLPMLEYLSLYPRSVVSTEFTPLGLFSNILLNRRQADLYAQTKGIGVNEKIGIERSLSIDHGWHEYGAYIGIIPFILFLTGSIAHFRRFWPLWLSGFICFLLALGNSRFLNLWIILRSLPFCAWLRVPSRFILGFMISVALFAGLGLKNFRQRLRQKTAFFTFVLLAIVIVDFLLINSQILKQAFTVAPMRNIARDEIFVQRQDFDSYIYKSGMRGGRYPAFLANAGVLKKVSNDIDSPRGAVHAVNSAEYRGEAYLINGKGEVSIAYFSPNKIILDVEAQQKDILVLNQNYYKGWRMKGNQENSVSSHEGLISAKVSPGKYKVTFYYLPNSFIIGSLITSLTLFLCLYYVIAELKRRS